MTQDEIIEMARKIAWQYSKAERFQTWTHDYMMQRLMELVAAEREACAKTVEKIETYEKIEKDCFKFAAKKIRARGQV